jgi:hypothetical protein
MDTLLRTPLDSSNLASVTYDPSDGVMEVQFRRTGHFYRYFDIPPELYEAFMEADSKDSFLNQVINTDFEYVRVDIPL